MGKYSAARYRSCEAMGTRFEMFLRGDDEQHLEAVAVAVCEVIQRLDGALSRFDKRSEISRVNREAIDKPVRVDRELFALLERCEQARELTEGYFDVTRCAALLLDVGNCAVKLAHPDAVIDLGGVGKGYALDCGREILERFGVGCGLLQGGTSSVLAIGDEAWTIDVRHPLIFERVINRIELANCGFSCSAVRHAGQSQSDIVNPLTGMPLTGNDACIVLATSTTDAEIFSTALLAMGRERAMRYLSMKPDCVVDVSWIEMEPV
jgi:thiamine biosynthesis lipoprotein